MRPRSRDIAIISTVVCLLNLQRLINQITLQKLMFIRERIVEDFVQGSESLLFLTAVLLSVLRRRRNFRRIGRRAWAWPRPQNWFDVILASPRLNTLWTKRFVLSPIHVQLILVREKWPCRDLGFSCLLYLIKLCAFEFFLYISGFLMFALRTAQFV